jgi:hypothetical protein
MRATTMKIRMPKITNNPPDVALLIPKKIGLYIARWSINLRNSFCKSRQKDAAISISLKMLPPNKFVQFNAIVEIQTLHQSQGSVLLASYRVTS